MYCFPRIMKTNKSQLEETYKHFPYLITLYAIVQNTLYIVAYKFVWRECGKTKTKYSSIKMCANNEYAHWLHQVISFKNEMKWETHHLTYLEAPLTLSIYLSIDVTLNGFKLNIYSIENERKKSETNTHHVQLLRSIVFFFFFFSLFIAVWEE